MSDRIETKVEVQSLDLTKLVEEATKIFSSNYPEKKNPQLSILRECGVVDTPNGKFVLSNEGVIQEQPVSEFHPFSIEFHASYEDDDSKGRVEEMVPCMRIKLSGDEFDALEVVGTKNLQDFVRTFGSRLDSNYNICRRFLEIQMGEREPEKKSMEMKDIINHLSIAMESMDGNEIADLYNEVCGPHKLSYLEDSVWELEII